MRLVGKSVSASATVLTALDCVTKKPVAFATGFFDSGPNVTGQDLSAIFLTRR